MLALAYQSAFVMKPMCKEVRICAGALPPVRFSLSSHREFSILPHMVGSPRAATGTFASPWTCKRLAAALEVSVSTTVWVAFTRPRGSTEPTGVLRLPEVWRRSSRGRLKQDLDNFYYKSEHSLTKRASRSQQSAVLVGILHKCAGIGVPYSRAAKDHCRRE